MESSASLRRRFESERKRVLFDPSPRFDSHGLTLGRGTPLLRSARETEENATVDMDRPAILLATVHGSIARPTIDLVKRAVERWQTGEQALAHIELAFARLPRLRDDDDALRLFFAEAALDGGMTPYQLGAELGLDLAKFDRDQPRVPAGNGRESGRWGSGSGSGRTALLVTPFATASAVASETAGNSFLTGASPAIVEALAVFASRFSVPTAVLGALFIPTPNSGGITLGVLPDAPDIRYESDQPAGLMRLRRRQDDGSETVVTLQSRGGFYVDVATGRPLGRDFGTRFFLELAAVLAATGVRTNAKSETDDDRPQLCPAPVKDTPHGTKEHVLDFEDDVHRRVNPLNPTPRAFAVQIIDPLTGKAQFPDDCYREGGDLIDGDMRPGDFADAKGEEYSRLLTQKFGWMVMKKLVNTTRKHLRAAQARKASLKIYFAEKAAADFVRKEFAKIDDLKNVKIGFLAPSKPKLSRRPKGRK